MVTNWAGNVTFGAEAVRSPESPVELVELVRAARRVHALGSGHSFNRIADTEGTLVSLSRMPAVFEVAPDRATVLAGGGMTLAELAGRLHSEGLALHTMPSLPHLTLAGACATATHGSGDGSGSLASAVREVELVTATGQRARFGQNHPDCAGVVVSLGALGVVTALRLAVRPTFDVEQRVYLGLSWQRLVERVDDILASAYSVSVFTAPRGSSRVWVKHRVGDAAPDLSWAGAEPAEVGAGPAGAKAESAEVGVGPVGVGAELAVGPGVAPADGPHHPVPGADPANCTDQTGTPGPWHERLPHFRPEFAPSTGAELQSEYLFDRADASAALQALGDLHELVAPVAQTIEVRSVAAEPHWLSPSYGRPSVGLHFTWRPDAGAVWPVVLACERAFAPLRPRPHWGKLFAISPAELSTRYEQWSRFRRLRQLLDPEHKFGNDLLDGYFPA